GYQRQFAEQIFRQLEGFGSYGFPESHAASFALLVYVSCWIKHYYPEVFAASLLNSQPMGFYAPAQLIIDAKRHGTEVRPIDINHSFWDNTLEDRPGQPAALRLGFRQIKGIRQQDTEMLIQGRKKSYEQIHFLLDAGVSLTTLERLADADAFRSLGLDRRQAFWEISALADRPQALFKGQISDSQWEKNIKLPVMSTAEHVIHDYHALSLSLKAHPVSFVRSALKQQNILQTVELEKCPDGTLVKVAGLVLVRQRPGTAKGVCFITLEDESGVANTVVFGNNY